MADLTLSQQVTTWIARLTVISRNLTDLSDSEATKLIRAKVKDAANGYIGLTREKAIQAIGGLDSLLEQYALLSRVVEEAAILAKKNGVFRNYDQRVTDLLHGPSVVVYSQQVAVNNRDLLDDGNRVVRLTPAEILAAMEEAFSKTRDALVSITNALATIRPQIVAYTQECAILQARAASLMIAMPYPPDIAQALALAERDPLGSAKVVDRLSGAIAAWRKTLQAAEAERQAMLDALSHARSALADLSDVVARAATAYTEAQELIATPEGVAKPAGNEASQSLETWLQTLEQTAKAGRFAAARVGLAKWEHQLQDLIATQNALYLRNHAGLDERAELRGRFQALHAKMNALRARNGVTGATPDQLAQQAQQILDAIPMDLPAGRRVVAAYEAAVLTAQK